MNSAPTNKRLGNYQLGRVLGTGAMGKVFEAYHRFDGRHVALKVMHDNWARDQQMRDRFLREVRLLQVAQHRHIVPLLDFGWQDEVLFLVMAFIDGGTLRERMDRELFTPRTAGEILQPLAEALDHTHAQGIIHRDLKPSNILIEGETGHLYLSDFGLSKRPGLDTNLTSIGMIVGTPYYISPEAVLGEDLDQRSDVYSFAVMIYQLLLNRVPFDKGDNDTTMFAHVQETVPLPTQLHGGFPPALEAVLLRALEKDRAMRYTSAGEFASDYQDALASLDETTATTHFGESA